MWTLWICKDDIKRSRRNIWRKKIRYNWKIKRFREAGHKTVPQIFLHIGGRTELEDFMFGDVDFEPDIHLVEDIKRKDLKSTAKIIPFKGKIGAISGDKEEEWNTK